MLMRWNVGCARLIETKFDRLVQPRRRRRDLSVRRRSAVESDTDGILVIRIDRPLYFGISAMSAMPRSRSRNSWQSIRRPGTLSSTCAR